MALRIFVFLYFTLYLFGPGLAQTTDIPFFHGLLIVPTGLYVGSRALKAMRLRVRFLQWDALAPVLLYAVVYSLLYFTRAARGAAIVVGGLTMVLHILFWHCAYTSAVYREHRQRFFADIVRGTALAAGIGFLYAQSVVGFRFVPGATHNLAERTLLIRSDFDVPFFALVIGAVGMAQLWRRRRLLPSIASVNWVRHPSVAVGLGLVAASLFTLFMYNRRTPMIAMAIATAVLALPTKWGLRSLYAAFVFPLIPFFWNLAVRIIVPLTQNEFVGSFLRRNDLETYLTATNRLGVWLDSIAYFTQFRLSHLWGYGGAPAEVLGSRPFWTHVHNGFLQLAFDAGLLTLALAVFVIVRVYRQLNVLVQVGTYRGDALALFAVFVAWLVMSGVEPTLREVSAGQMYFLLVATVTASLYSETTRSPLGSRVILLHVPRRPSGVLLPS